MKRWRKTMCDGSGVKEGRWKREMKKRAIWECEERDGGVEREKKGGNTREKGRAEELEGLKERVDGWRDIRKKKL